MKELFRNFYFIGYSILYVILLLMMLLIEHFPISEAIAVLLIIGVFFSFMAHISTRKAIKLSDTKPAQSKEILVLLLLLIYVTGMLSFGIDQIKSILPDLFSSNNRAMEIFTITYKLLIFFILPFLAYKYIYKFNLRDFGLKIKAREFFTRKNAVVLLTMGLTILLFQFFLGNGAKPIRDGLLTGKQLIIGLPLFYAWLFFEVGLVEEFFFRSVLLSRLAALTRSETGGIILSGLFFGLAHAPGYYLRGSGVLDNLGASPSLFMSIGYSIVVLSVAGFFLSIIWSRTRNLWLVMAVHAFVDLLPGISEFINTWGIQ